MNETKEAKNKALVLEAIDAFFGKREYPTAERYWSPQYIQHSAHIAPGREGLFNLVESAPPTNEPGVILAEGDFLIVHGRFSGNGRPVAWIAADILCITDGVLVEHWDVLQDDATRADSKKRPPDVWRPFLAVGRSGTSDTYGNDWHRLCAAPRHGLT
jgi:predicted SnoaL-like aldol condensation-catalyzing enzyme